ncbi:hypothetical protein NDN08_001287 [Rhodosorus marinus]|uniref:EamA domain-containing protein n=1 Tax=Rhodosorus marinus TaxID=101924 RepID=A0AAV8UTE1_9RHOD|nr:hypothetical protein NDN08_001287 [Rhodosorus marinus]
MLSFTGTGVLSTRRSGRMSQAIRKRVVVASVVPEKAEAKVSIGSAALPGAVIGFSVVNRVIYRTLLVPMKDYTFFITQFITFAYVAVYGAFLMSRRKKGIVTDDMIAVAKNKWKTFALIGGLEALTLAVQLYSGARLPGSLLGILSQGILPFTMICSILLRGRKYSALQVSSIGVIIAGVLVTIYPTFSSLSSTLGMELLVNSALFFMSCGFIALALVLKEGALQGESLDIFVVNTSSSFMQMLAAIVLMPFSFAVALGGLSLDKSLDYVHAGVRTAVGMEGLRVTPYIGLAYMTVNLIMNILGITLIKNMSAVTAILTSIATVPIVTLVFCLDLPLLAPQPFTPLFVLGVLAVLVGLAMYNYEGLQKARAAKDKT